MYDVCFIGTSSNFSRIALQTLCGQGLKVSRCILAGHAPARLPANTLPVASQPAEQTTAQLAGQHRIPVDFFAHPRQGEKFWQGVCRTSNDKKRPAFVFVACFPYKLPDIVLSWPEHYCVNLHPSLLPAYRGADPIFWQLRYNESHTGISLHVISDTLDTGPLLHQQAISFPKGATRKALDSLLAKQGALAFSHLLDNLHFLPTPQQQLNVSHQPPPSDDDYHLDTRWSAEHAYNFMRGTLTPPGGYPITLGDTQLRLKAAWAFSTGTDPSVDTKSITQNNKLWKIPFSPGVLHAESL